jgi:hypothetical protein
VRDVGRGSPYWLPGKSGETCSVSRYRYGRAFISLILACGLLGCAPPPKVAAGAQRLRPPESLQCPRNNLTAFSGTVSSFQRKADRAVIRLDTDEKTAEQFTLYYQEGADPTPWFLLKAKPFQSDDWELIESAPNRLLPEMRAIVWVCDDGSNPVIDWRPSETGRSQLPR